MEDLLLMDVLFGPLPSLCLRRDGVMVLIVCNPLELVYGPIQIGIRPLDGCIDDPIPMDVQLGLLYSLCLR